ncbi:5-methyltetrahydropteroyltriglutamate--homocysteine methyltransferase [Thermococcus sp. M39]|uniref:5-methyltetrahydropteroyltriglutamate-- homocysteine methyltransferase n=1 Tax=unclassified Thermococcus TaxID=2627626 RepID=UPI00143B73B5|nr:MULTISPECIES: 5-methyltetrahydropteroyltriglutamate--homocysteine methyltransferase [unclassified Thermococcus]NJE09178.1 5-methyltetrahydropteroyltriglutamate--homocysteine methyltransferase [Thermococcus sp. M39]NJE13097.1 5-methyltetrahydropteroyltriglutamate--homocysteine methyltransferase [Thermococcus sp. LS2]
MKVVPALIGSLPRPVSLAKKLEQYYIGRLSEEEIEKAYREHTRRAFKKLADAGIKIITDGLYRWDDIFNPLIKFIDGIEVNGLFKFYENNFFYRSPIVKGELSLRENPIPEWINIAKGIQEEVYPEATLKAVLPGPVTLAYHSINEHYKSLNELAEAYAESVLKPLIRELDVEIVELQEPALAAELSRATKEKADEVSREVAKRIIEDLAKEKRLWVVTYFGTPQVVPEGAILNVDLVEGSIPDGVRGEIGIGIVNARETKMERRNELKDKLVRVARGFDTIYVTPNTLLDFLPESVAWRKLKLLERLAE